MNVIDSFNEAFSMEPEDEHPSSFWDENMVMISDESLTLEMRLYSAWNEYNDRKRGEWYWHAPTRIFRLPSETQYLVAQKPGQWLCYDTNDRKIKLQCGQRTIQEYETLLDAISAN